MAKGERIQHKFGTCSWPFSRQKVVLSYKLRDRQCHIITPMSKELLDFVSDFRYLHLLPCAVEKPSSHRLAFGDLRFLILLYLQPSVLFLPPTLVLK